MDLSIVIICRNEEAAIGACIESLLEETSGIEREIILVDSASTDRTVEIAKKYPVAIVCIDPKAMLTPSAGRYLGTLRATGEYILFVDGDMILIRDWIQKALACFGDASVGAVAGRLFRVFPGEQPNYNHGDASPLGPVDRLGGAGLYRRSVLGKAGSFNPFVKGEEERELGYRIIRSGYKILRIEAPMVFHMEKRRTKSEIDENAGHFTGVGQMLRRYGLRRISWDLLWSHRRVFNAHVALLLFLAALAFFLALGNIFLFVAAVGIVAVCFLLLILVKGKEKVFLMLRSRLLILANIIKGMRLGIPDASDYNPRTSTFSMAGKR
ncbi:glycosyltransferase [bacterium]|nr:MAG: glycosyltransferase [bacterium]